MERERSTYVSHRARRGFGAYVVDGRIFDLDTGTISVLAFDRGTPVVKRWNLSP